MGRPRADVYKALCGNPRKYGPHWPLRTQYGRPDPSPLNARSPGRSTSMARRMGQSLPRAKSSRPEGRVCHHVGSVLASGPRLAQVYALFNLLRGSGAGCAASSCDAAIRVHAPAALHAGHTALQRKVQFHGDGVPAAQLAGWRSRGALLERDLCSIWMGKCLGPSHGEGEGATVLPQASSIAGPQGLGRR